MHNSQTELERHWQERCLKAKLDLEKARAHVQTVKENMSYGADTGNAYKLALEQETAALIEYSRVLRIYADLVFHGRVPDEGQGTSAE